MKKMGISNKLSIIAFIMIILCASVIGILSIFLFRRDTIDANAERALAIAVTFASHIDIEEYQNIMASGEKNQYYEKIKESIGKVKAENELIYFYVLDSDYSEVVSYFLDAADAGYTDDADLLDEEDIDVFPEEMFETIRTGENTVTDLYNYGGLGSMLSGYTALKDSSGKVVGVVGADISLNEVMKATNQFTMIIILIALVSSILFGILVGRYAKSVIGKPIKEITNAGEKIAVGDIDITINVNSQDEIGILAQTFNNIIDNTKKQIHIMEDLAKGKLSIEVEQRSNNDRMNVAINQMIENLNQKFWNITDAANQVLMGAGQLSDQATSLSQNTSQHSNTIDQIDDAVKTIIVQTKDSTELINKAVKLSEDIILKAEEGSKQMYEMTHAVNDINEANFAIEKVMKTIDDIAFQTNILALNASVEAARAGEHGKGFAIVAEEVRKLATKSAGAANETSVLITNSIEKAKMGADISEITSGAFKEIEAGIIESAKMVRSVSESSNEQVNEISKINSSISHMSELVLNNAAAAEESAAASEEMRTQAQVLQDMVEEFELKKESSF